jgi:hypothetical protein
MAKRATLSGLTHKKPAVEAAAPARRDIDDAAPAKAEAAPTKGLIVRLAPPSWKQLKQLALDQETSIHSLLLEGVNLVFDKYGKPPIA